MNIFKKLFSPKKVYMLVTNKGVELNIYKNPKGSRYKYALASQADLVKISNPSLKQIVEALLERDRIKTDHIVVYNCITKQRLPVTTFLSQI